MNALFPDPTLIDPTRRHLLIALAVGVPSLVIVGFATAAMATRGLPEVGADLTFLALVTLVVFGIAAMSAITTALCILASARRTARIYARLQQGDALADWRFERAEWDDWLTSERGRDPWSETTLLGCIVFILLIGGWVVSQPWADLDSSERTGKVLLVAGAILVVAALFGFGRWAGRRRASAMRGRPRVMVLENAIYCGGALRRWGAEMIVLRRIAVVPGPPTVLEVTIGPNDGLKTATTMVNLLAALSGGGGAARTAHTTFRVPVPAGRADEAAGLVRRLMAGRESLHRTRE